MKNYLVKMTTLLVFIVTSFPSFAVVPNGNWTYTRNFSAGSFFAVLRTHADNICALTKVSMEELDSVDESAECRVYKSGSSWVLETKLGKDGNAKVSCSATCYR